MEKMRVKKYKTIFCVKLTAGILLLFTLIPNITFSLYENNLTGGSAFSALPVADIDIGDIDVEDLFPSLSLELQDYEIPALEESRNDFLNVPSDHTASYIRITTLATQLDDYYSSLDSQLERIEFYLDKMLMPDITRCEFILHHIPQEDWGDIDYNQIYSDLLRRKNILEQARQWIEAQKSEIESIYGSLLNLGLAEFEFDFGAFDKFQRFKNEFLEMDESEIIDRINELRQELGNIQYQKNHIHQQLNNAKPGRNLWKDGHTPLGRFAYNLYNSMVNFLQGIDSQYQQVSAMIERYVDQESLLVQINPALKRLAELMDKYNFLYQPGSATVLCYLEKLLGSLRFETRRNYLERISSDLGEIKDLYKNLIQYEDLLSGIAKWDEITRKIRTTSFDPLYNMSKRLNGERLIDAYYAGDLGFRLAQLSIALAVQFQKFLQNPSLLLSQNFDFPEIQELGEMLLDLGEARDAISFFEDNGILPDLVETSRSSLSELQETNPDLSVDVVQKYYDAASRVMAYLHSAQYYESQRMELSQRLGESISENNDSLSGRISSEIQEISRQLEEVTDRRNEALQNGWAILSQISVNTDSHHEGSWTTVGETTSYGEPVTSLVTESDNTATVSTPSVSDSDSQPQTTAVSSQEPVVHTQSVGENSGQSTSSADGAEEATGPGYRLTPQHEGGEEDGLVHAQAVDSPPPDSTPPDAGSQDTGSAPLTENPENPDIPYDSELTSGQEGPSGQVPGGDSIVSAQGTEDDGPLSNSIGSPSSLDFADQGFGDNKEDDNTPDNIGGVGSTIFGNDHGTTGDNSLYKDDENLSIPEVTGDIVNGYIIEIGDRIFNINQPYTNYSEINDALAQVVFDISANEMDSNNNGFSEVDEETYTQLENFFTSTERGLNGRIKEIKQLTANDGNKEVVLEGQSGIESIEGVRILGMIGIGEKGSYMVVRPQSEVSEKGKISVRSRKGADKEGAVSKEESQTEEGEHAEGVTVLENNQEISPDKAYVINIKRAIDMVQSGENIERICEETGLSKDVVKAIQEAWKNGTILKNSTGAYLIVQVEVNGEKKIIVIPADTIVYITSSKPSEIVKEIIKKVFLKKPQASDATVNRILILLILLAVICMAGGIALAVMVTRREYRKWLEYQPPVYKKPSKETKPVYTKFVTGYHSYYKK
jgi:hypothetical protein